MPVTPNWSFIGISVHVFSVTLLSGCTLRRSWALDDALIVKRWEVYWSIPLLSFWWVSRDWTSSDQWGDHRLDLQWPVRWPQTGPPVTSEVTTDRTSSEVTTDRTSSEQAILLQWEGVFSEAASTQKPLIPAIPTSVEHLFITAPESSGFAGRNPCQYPTSTPTPTPSPSPSPTRSLADSLVGSRTISQSS